MSRWVWWFLVVPQLFVLEGLLRDLGAPPIDVAALLCVFLAFFADAAALPLLLVGCALGRALVDEAALPVQLLVLGVPTAVLLPFRSLFFGQRWLWQATAAALCAILIPKLAGLCGRWFDEPSASAALDGMRVFWAAALLPPLLLLARRTMPFAPFAEAPSR